MKKMKLENLLYSKGYVSIEALIVAGLIIASGSFMVSKLVWKGKDISVKSNNSLTNSKKILDNDNFSNVNMDNKTKDSVKKDVVNVKSKTSIKSYDEIIRTPGSKYIFYADLISMYPIHGRYCSNIVLGSDVPKNIDINATKENPLYIDFGGCNPTTSKSKKLYEDTIHAIIKNDKVYDENDNNIGYVSLNKESKLYEVKLYDSAFIVKYRNITTLPKDMPIYGRNKLNNYKVEYIGTSEILKNKYDEVTSKPNAIWLYDDSDMSMLNNRANIKFGFKPDSNGNITINATEEKPIMINDKVYTSSIKAYINKDDNKVYFENGEKIGNVTKDGCAKVIISNNGRKEIMKSIQKLDLEVFNEHNHINRINSKYHC